MRLHKRFVSYLIIWEIIDIIITVLLKVMIFVLKKKSLISAIVLAGLLLLLLAGNLIDKEFSICSEI